MGSRRVFLILVAVVIQACSQLSPSPARLDAATPIDASFLDDLHWQQLGTTELPGLPPLDLVAAGGRGLVAVGKDSVWLSDDGLAWSRSDGKVPTGAAWRRLIGTRDGSVFAVGNAFRATPPSVLLRITADGIENLAFQGSHDLIGDVTEFDGHLVVIGGDDLGHGIVWKSRDGVKWTETDLSELPLFTIASAGTSRLVAADVKSAPELSDGRLRFWHSTDGVRWEAAASFPSASAADMIALPNGFIAVGDALRSDADHRLVPAAWSSGDGATWVPMTTPVGDGVLSAVTTWRGVPIAVGWTLSTPQLGVIWANRGGQSWEPFAVLPLEGMRLTDVLAVNDRLIIVGVGADSSTDPVILTGTAPN